MVYNCYKNEKELRSAYRKYLLGVPLESQLELSAKQQAQLRAFIRNFTPGRFACDISISMANEGAPLATYLCAALRHVYSQAQKDIKEAQHRFSYRKSSPWSKKLEEDTDLQAYLLVQKKKPQPTHVINLSEVFRMRMHGAFQAEIIRAGGNHWQVTQAYRIHQALSEGATAIELEEKFKISSVEAEKIVKIDKEINRIVK